MDVKMSEKHGKASRGLPGPSSTLAFDVALVQLETQRTTCATAWATGDRSSPHNLNACDGFCSTRSTTLCAVAVSDWQARNRGWDFFQQQLSKEISARSPIDSVDESDRLPAGPSRIRTWH